MHCCIVREVVFCPQQPAPLVAKLLHFLVDLFINERLKYIKKEKEIFVVVKE